MSFSGMLLALFLVAHMSGNLLILVSHSKFNEYAYLLTSNKLLLFSAEAGLIALLALHVWMAISVTRRNRAARPIPYAVTTNSGRSRRWWGSSNMGITGTFILLFVIYHLIHFKFGPHYTTVQGETEMRDLAKLVFDEFQKPVEVFLYVAAMILIGFHLLHGIRSMFDTLGLNQTKWDKTILRFSYAYVLIVFGGFIIIPLAIFFLGVGV